MKKKKKEPVFSKQANTSGSVLEISVWLNEVELENKETIEVHAITLHRSYKKDGEWQQTQSLRPQDLLAAAHLLQQSYDFCNQ